MPFIEPVLVAEDLDFEAIKTGVNITSVLAQYAPVPATKRTTYRMACPLHNGDNATCFKVNEQDGSWWCFKCHKGGDVISLVAHFEQITNGEAARKLANNFHIYARSNRYFQEARKTRKQMENWRERQLAPPPLAEGQVPETIELDGFRGYSKATIDHFGLRRIPGEDWGSGIYIPIKSPDGTLIGYSIRQHDQFMPKYLNSQGLKKQGVMFGLAENGETIKRAGAACLVEGQFDALSLYERWFIPAVAVMGSNLSVPQALVLARYTTHLILLFDGDEAGRKGMAQIQQRFGSAFDITIIELADGIDPDTMTTNDLSDALKDISQHSRD